ncbi:MAG: phosphoglycerate kinase [Planctomycetaceae bacterium]|nr:phosphoglycerate kinase [Planctomycetaceae bacterium]
MAKKTVSDINVSGKTVFVRVDFNVPIKGGKVTNDNRIVQALPTIQKLIASGAKCVLASHLGRPEGKGFEADGSMAPVAKRLGELLKKDVQLGPQDVAGPAADAMIAKLPAGGVLLLENLRFSAGETMPDNAKKNPDAKLTPEQDAVLKDFVAKLAAKADAYVNDAFGTCHRKHASMYGVAKAVQAKGGPAVAGILVEKEIRYLHEAVAKPARPFVAILGGAKVSDKIKLISALLTKVDNILIGGAMAYTLLAAKGVKVGKSLVEKDQVEPMKELLGKAQGKILLPVDHVATDDFAAGKPQAVAGENIPDGVMGMDIGPKSVSAFSKAIAAAKTIVWNGPMGVFERADYAAGTRAVAEAVAKATDAGAVSVIGGGDSAAAVEEMGLADRMTHVSTGGGASLTYLEGKAMPAIEVLDEK